MSTPHDYYKHGPEFPELHNRHEGIPYVDPDYFANHHDDQLPILSTIGRGARGEGVTAQRDSEGNLLILNENNEVLCQFALGDWNISIVPNPTHNIQEGQNSYFDVIIDNGVGKKSERVVVPCGEQGSRVFLYKDGNLPAKTNQTYQILKSSLKPSERYERKSYNPDPRVNDIIFAESGTETDKDFVVGYITSSYDDYVVMVEAMRIPVSVGEINIDESQITNIYNYNSDSYDFNTYKGRRVSEIPDIADEVAEYDNEWLFLANRCKTGDWSGLHVGDWFEVPLFDYYTNHADVYDWREEVETENERNHPDAPHDWHEDSCSADGLVGFAKFVIADFDVPLDGYSRIPESYDTVREFTSEAHTIPCIMTEIRSATKLTNRDPWVILYGDSAERGIQDDLPDLIGPNTISNDRIARGGFNISNTYFPDSLAKNIYTRCLIEDLAYSSNIPDPHFSNSKNDVQYEEILSGDYLSYIPNPGLSLWTPSVDEITGTPYPQGELPGFTYNTMSQLAYFKKQGSRIFKWSEDGGDTYHAGGWFTRSCCTTGPTASDGITDIVIIDEFGVPKLINILQADARYFLGNCWRMTGFILYDKDTYGDGTSGRIISLDRWNRWSPIHAS